MEEQKTSASGSAVPVRRRPPPPPLIPIFFCFFWGQALRVLCVAEAYGFGPAAAIRSIARALRPVVQTLVFAGTGHTVELQQDAGFDQIHTLTTDAELDLLLGQTDLVITNTEWNSMQRALDRGVGVVVVDQLLWYWDSLEFNETLAAQACLYLAQDFFGVREKLDTMPNVAKVARVVSRPTTQVASQQMASAAGKKGLLVSFGGLSNPTRSDHAFVPYVRAISAATSARDPTLYGSRALAALSGQPLQTVTRETFAQALGRARVVGLTPGLGHMYEAADVPVVWLPPTNPSQAKQLALLHAHGAAPVCVEWRHILERVPEAMTSATNCLRFTSTELNRAIGLCLAELETDMENVVERLRLRFDACLDARATPVLRSLTEDRRPMDLACRDYVTELQVSTVQLAAGLQGVLIAQPGFEFDPVTVRDIEACVPGEFVVVVGNKRGPTCVRITQTYSDTRAFVRLEASDVPTLRLVTRRDNKVPADFAHVLAGLVRLEWCRTPGSAVVHGAVLETKPGQYTLVTGPSGSGKTSTVMHCVKLGARVFSGDKTLVRIDKSGKLRAYAGTRTLTVRAHDDWRWDPVPKEDVHELGDRIAFRLPASGYCSTEVVVVPIDAIVLVRLGANSKVDTLAPRSALHRLFPLFLSQHTGDVLIQGSQQLLDGNVSAQNKLELAKRLERANVPTCVYHGPVDGLGAVGLPALPSLPGPLRILWGVCGIGNGHRNRQEPLIRHALALGATVVVFTTSESCLAHFQRMAKAGGYSSMHVVKVVNPYLQGNSRGLDFDASAKLARERHHHQETVAINCRALAEADRILGTPDLVVSDYECVSAQFGHSKGAPVVTIDQQSKYFLPGFPLVLNNTSFWDEIERLRLFFPNPTKRIAMSFFRPPAGESPTVTVIGPVMKASIRAIADERRKRTPSAELKVVVYMTAQVGTQSVSAWVEAVRAARMDRKPVVYYVFVPPERLDSGLNASLPDFIHVRAVPDPAFASRLAEADAVITTAGHTLLSECMFLGIPVLAVPLALYEQQANAEAISRNGFGLQANELSSDIVSKFLASIPHFRRALETDPERALTKSSTAQDVWQILADVLPRGRSGNLYFDKATSEQDAVVDGLYHEAVKSDPTLAQRPPTFPVVANSTNVFLHRDVTKTVLDLERLGVFRLVAHVSGTPPNGRYLNGADGRTRIEWVRGNGQRLVTDGRGHPLPV